jgi:hypothetical protein
MAVTSPTLASRKSSLYTQTHTRAATARFTARFRDAGKPRQQRLARPSRRFSWQWISTSATTARPETPSKTASADLCDLVLPPKLWKARGHGLPGLDEAGHEAGLHLGDRVIDRHAGAFIEDLDAGDLHGAGSALFVGAGQGDIEGQDLVGVPGRSFLLEAGDGRDRSAAELVDGRARGDAVGTHQRRLVDRVLRQESILVGHELGTEIVDVGDELALQLVDQVQFRTEEAFGGEYGLFYS